MSDPFLAQLSPYLDGELDDISRARLEAHLGECLECASILADLRALVAAAAEHPGRAPERDLWPAIRAGLDDTRILELHPVAALAGPPARGRFGWRELIAASVLMAAVGGAAGWLAFRGPGSGVRSGAATRAAEEPADTPVSAANVDFSEAKYDTAVRDLEVLLSAGRDRLDSATVRIVEQNLRRIDDAIAEARAAIQQDPANAYLSRQIAANMRRKLHLLRVATNAIATRT
jgi:hypothetical protein